MACFELDKIVTLPHSFLHQFPQGVEVVEITPELLSSPGLVLKNEDTPLEVMVDYIMGFAFPTLINGLEKRGITSKVGITRIVVSRVHGTEFACVNMHLKDENENTHFVWFYPVISDTGRGSFGGKFVIHEESGQWGGNAKR